MMTTPEYSPKRSKFRLKAQFVALLFAIAPFVLFVTSSNAISFSGIANSNQFEQKNTGNGTHFSEDSKVQNTRSLLLLHTNDVHDHLRPSYDGIGGLPFVSGFIRDIKRQREDVIVMDAGDYAEKGDLITRKTHSDLTFKTAKRIGYDVWTPGNHDHDFGIEALHRFTELAEMDIVCINLLKEDGSPEFSPSKIYEINGIRIGVIGAITPRNELSLNDEETMMALAAESRKIESSTDLIVALMHIPVRHAAMISEQAPDIDVFVTGHSHEILHEPHVVANTGALILQAGYYGRYVGALELEIDLDNRDMASYSYNLVEMNHKTISPDVEMIEMIRQAEMEIAPEASEIVAWVPRVITRIEVGILAAEALRTATNSDVAFHKTYHVVRNILPQGILDLNAVYRTGGERGEFLYQIELTGIQIREYIETLPRGDWRPTNWSGFHGEFEGDKFTTNLDDGTVYKVVMPHREYFDRFRRIHDRATKYPVEWPTITQLSHTEPIILETKWIEAMRLFLGILREDNVQLLDAVDRIATDTGQEFFLTPVSN